VVMHDVTPVTWAACRRLFDALSEVGPYAATLLVVPRYHTGVKAEDDRGFCSTLSGRLERGDELVLHGFTHHDDAPFCSPWQVMKRRLYTAGEGEFATLSEADALARIQLGMEWFTREGWPLYGFVAPAWLMSAGTKRALEKTSLSYTTTLGGIHFLKDGQSIASQSLVFSSRSAWRRTASHLWADILKERLRKAPIVRLGLHPADAAHPHMVAHWQRLFQEFQATHHPVTKHGFVENVLARGNSSVTPALALD